MTKPAATRPAGPAAPVSRGHLRRPADESATNSTINSAGRPSTGEPADPWTVRILTTGVSDDEVAAVVIAIGIAGVIARVIAVAPAQPHTHPPPASAGGARRTSNWAAAARQPRAPLTPGIDRWRQSAYGSNAS
ncbi:MAG: hypothetical protein ACRCYU_16640 [Nocardioides sp.]